MKIVFMGTPEFAKNILQRLIEKKYDVVLVITQPDRPVGRKKELLPTPVKQLAIEHNISVIQPEKIKLDYQAIVDVQPDLIITAAYGQIIPKALIDLPRLGCINVHASLLPKYRGGAPIHQAIIDGAPETGVTIMYMDVTMDTGDIITQAKTPITLSDDVGTMFDKLSVVGAELLIETLPTIANGTNPRIPQNHDEATYAYNIKRADELIDWGKSASEINNQIRGLNPWPTAYTTINGINVKVFRAKTIAATTIFPVDLQGQIVAVVKDKIHVIAGDQELLELAEIQLAGKKRMPIKDILNGDHPFVVGARFGT